MRGCSGLAGFCAIYKHFSGFGLFLLSGIIPARQPLTQTVVTLHSLIKNTEAFNLRVSFHPAETDSFAGTVTG